MCRYVYDLPASRSYMCIPSRDGSWVVTQWAQERKREYLEDNWWVSNKQQEKY